MTAMALDVRELSLEEIDWVNGADRGDAAAGGAAVGVTLGAAAGAYVGGVAGTPFAGIGAFPGAAVGTIIGAVIGGIVGGVGGFFGGGKLYDLGNKKGGAVNVKPC